MLGGLYFRFKGKASSGKILPREREYDAVVFYDFDHDNEFVTNTILPALEETHDPPFKLCFSDRDFLLGVSIRDNIDQAINSSNSAIIIISQAYLDSLWCTREFQQARLENIRDPAFKVFVIMMQPEHTLTNKPSFMNRELDYYGLKLDSHDPRLFEKISTNLTEVRKPAIKSRTRLIMESICNSSVCGQTHGGSSFAFSDETSFGEQLLMPNKEEHQVDGEPLPMPNKEEHQVDGEPLLPRGTVVETVVEVHTENKDDYELLEEECDALDRYYEKMLNDTSENEIKEGPIEPHISDQAPIERDLEFEKESGELNKVTLFSLSRASVYWGIDEDNERTKKRNSTDLERNLTSHEEPCSKTSEDGTIEVIKLNTIDRKPLDPECNQIEMTKERQNNSPEDVRNSTQLANFVEEIPLTEKTQVTTRRNPSREKIDEEEKHDQDTCQQVEIERDMEQSKYDF